MKVIGEVLDEGKSVRKVLWEGKFNSENLDFKDSTTDLGSECKIIRYIDPNLNDTMKGEIGSAIYDLTSKWDWPCGADDEKTEFYINIQPDQFVNGNGYNIQVFCKPCPLDYDIQNNQEQNMWQKKYDASNDEKEKAMIKDFMEKDLQSNKECKENQDELLAELGADGGEWATFDLELTDAEKIELLEYLAFEIAA